MRKMRQKTVERRKGGKKMERKKQERGKEKREKEREKESDRIKRKWGKKENGCKARGMRGKTKEMEGRGIL